MSDELVRVMVGLPIATLWPLGVPSLASRWWSRAAAATVTALLVLATTLPEAEGWLLLALNAGLAAVLRPPATASGGRAQGARPVPLYRAVGAALLLAAVSAALRPTTTWDALRDGARDDHLVFVLLGILAAVPLAGALVSWTMSPLAARLAAAPGLASTGMLSAGRYIGWCERALVFGFLVGGEPGAAGLALTAKSVARFPAFTAGSEPLAEYVLIGTLLSFLLATAVALGVRGLLGLPAF